MRRVLARCCYVFALPFIVIGAIGFGLLDAIGDIVSGRT